MGILLSLSPKHCPFRGVSLWLMLKVLMRLVKSPACLVHSPADATGTLCLDEAPQAW